MEDDKKYLYAKFKMDTKSGIMQNQILSENRSTVDQWIGARRKMAEGPRIVAGAGERRLSK